MDSGSTDCDFMFRSAIHPDVLPGFLDNPNGMMELMHSFARDEVDVYDEVDVSKRTELEQRGKVVIVTGAGRGIGREIALMFAKAKARAVCIFSRTRTDLEETKKTINDLYPETTIFAGIVNVSREEEVKSFFDAVVNRFQIVDVVVSNAAVLAPFERIVESDTLSWWNSFEVNLKGTYLVSKHFARVLGDASGTFINLSACHGLGTVPNQSDYSISKLATARLIETLHLESPNIRFFSVHPGVVRTDLSTEVQISMGVDLRWNWTSAKLVAAVCLWVTTQHAEFLRGRWFSANWRVDDFEAQANDIVNQNLLKTAFNLKLGS